MKPQFLRFILFSLLLVLPLAGAEATSDGELVGTPTPLRNVPAEVAAIADGKMVAYYMPAIRGGQTIATAMLFIPKGPAPAGGWPLVVFGHDTTGWARECAPSVYLQKPPQETMLWYLTPWVVDMLKSGMVVIAPDYEGMGPAKLGVPDTGHPYYNLLSTGRSMAYAAVAAKRALGDKLSGAWASAGLSEGGFAALAAAQYSDLAKQRDASLDYRGAAAAAPAMYRDELGAINWASIVEKSITHDLEAGFDELTFFNTEPMYIVKSAIGAGYQVNPADIFGDRLLRIYDTKIRLCLTELRAAVSQDVNEYWFENRLVNTPDKYPGLKIEALSKNPGLKAFNEENQIRGQVKLPGDILLVQGTTDSASALPTTLRLAQALLLNGTNVRLAVYEGADHFGVIIPALPVIQAHLQMLFAKP